MANLIADQQNVIRLTNFPMMIDQQFDLDEALSLAEMSIQYDDQDDQITTIDEEATTQNPNNMINVDSCAVCMESFDAGECREPITCCHVYHPGCIATWLSVCSSCPLCRHRISGGDQFSSTDKQS